MEEQRVQRTSTGMSGDNFLGCKNVYTNWLADGVHSSDDGSPSSNVEHCSFAEPPRNMKNPVPSLPSAASAAARLTRAAWHSKDPKPACHVHTLQAAGANADVKGVAFTRMSASGYLNPSPQPSPRAKMKPTNYVQPLNMPPTSSKQGQVLHHAALRNVSRRTAGPAGLCSAAPASKKPPQLTPRQACSKTPTRQTVPARATGLAAPERSRHSSASTAVMGSCSSRTPCSSGRGLPGSPPSFMPDAAAPIRTDDDLNKYASKTAPTDDIGDGAATSAQSAIMFVGSNAGQGWPVDVCADTRSVACRRVSTSSEVSTVFESVRESFGGMSTDSTGGSASGQPRTPTGLPGLSLSRASKAVHCINTSRKLSKHANSLHAMYDKTTQGALLNLQYRSSLDAAIRRARTSSASEVSSSFSQSGEGTKAGGATAMDLLTRCDPSSVIAAVTTIASVSASVAAAAAAQVAAAAVAELENSQAAAKQHLTAAQQSAEKERSTQHPTAVHATVPGSVTPLNDDQVPTQADQCIMLQLIPSAAPFLALQALRSKRIELIITHKSVFCAAHDPCPADSHESFFLRAALKGFRNRVTAVKLAPVAAALDVSGVDVQSRQEEASSDGDGKSPEPAARACSVSSMSVKGARPANVSSNQPGCYPSMNIYRWLKRRDCKCA